MPPMTAAATKKKLPPASLLGPQLLEVHRLAPENADHRKNKTDSTNKPDYLQQHQ
jgi:hypothetical protein